LTPLLGITGMHRSGTSLVANALARAGLRLGDKLKGPTPFNPDGYFEDVDLVGLHDRALARRGIAWHTPSDPGPLSFPPDLAEEARALLGRKMGGVGAWGWKDPRTTLFLDFWADAFPDARFVFVYRDPSCVAASLLSRGDLRTYSPSVPRQAWLALCVWTVYNRRMLAFVRRSPSRAALVRVVEDLDDQGGRRLDEVVRAWELALDSIRFCDVRSPGELLESAPRWLRALARAHAGARRTLARLDRERAARLPVDSRPADSGAARSPTPRPVVCVVTPGHGAYSETFVRAQLRRLPARLVVLNGEYYPGRLADGRRLLSLPARVVNAVLRRLGSPLPTSIERAAFRRHLRRGRVEAVLAEFGQAGAEVWQDCRDLRVPLLVHFRGAEASKATWLRQYGDAYREMLAYAATTFAGSREIARRLVSMGAPPERLVHCPSGVDTALFRGGDPVNAPPRFVAAHRFVDKKGPHLTVLAFSRLLPRCPDARLIMIGDGPLLEACRQLTRALVIDRSVAFPGARSQLDVAAEMREARAVVLHAVTTSDGDMEGTPNVLLEAGATGLPVVATRHAGIPDIVKDGETGFLVDEGDVEAMAERMLELASNSTLAAAMGRRAREEIATRYSLEQSVGLVWAALERAIDHSQRPVQAAW
jgi:glycosyltransferase involved in cell wall biosynthesis